MESMSIQRKFTQSQFVLISNWWFSTVPDGNEEDIRRANELAMEIENNNESQKNRLLENDDEERDLDKETRFNSDRDGGRGQKRQSGGGYPNK